MYMYALLGKYHELWTFRPVFFIPVIVTTSPHSIIFHYHLIFIFFYFHHYLFHSSFSLLGVMIDECLKHSSYTRVGSSFLHLFHSNSIVFVDKSLILCLV